MTEPQDNLKILFFDIETVPSLGWVWGKYEQDVISFEKEWYIISFAAKWMGSPKIISHTISEYPGYKKDPESDKSLLKDLWALMDEADIIIGHNADKFDIKKTNMRLLYHGFQPPSPYKTIDTLKMAKKHFRFDSNRLDDLATTLGIGEKAETGGFKLWKGCIQGDKKSWNKMQKYNEHDVVLLEKIYLRMRPWIKAHPKITFTQGEACDACGSQNTQRRGYNYTKTRKYHRFCCKDCGAWSQGIPEKIKSSK